MDRSEASALADLQMHWDEAYSIGLDGDIWRASFRGTADELRAHTSSELRDLIRADYAYRQRARPSTQAEREAGGRRLSTRGDNYDDAYDGAFRADDAATGQPTRTAERVSFADIRGERMST